MKKTLSFISRYALRATNYIGCVITSSNYLIISLFLFFFSTADVNAAYLKDIPTTVVQPNGDILQCYASGDEFFNYLHDENGYTIIQNANGYYMYAVYAGNEIIPSQFVAGTVNPSKVGLKPNVVISNKEYQKRRAEWFNFQDISRSKSPTRNQGTLNNLVVFIRFSDEDDITKPFSTVESMYNNETPGFNSMYNYFRTTSYKKLFVPSYFFPVHDEEQILSYQDEFPRSYYQPYNEETNPDGYQDDRTEREHTLLRKAIEYIADLVPEDLDIDYDNNGTVDNVCFVVKGSTTAWATLLWPHRWSLYSDSVCIHGKRVWDYNFMLEGASGYFNTSVLSHEMQHTLSYPDLYHYSYSGPTPVGNWDIMESNPNPPQQSGAYMKWKYGNWLNEPEEMPPGEFTLNSVGSGIEPVSYKISSSDPSQFFVLEFRNRDDSFDKIYGTGLVIYRINTNFHGNAGYNPDEGVFDEVYIFRPDGNSPIQNGYINRAHFGVRDRFEFNESTNPRPFLTDGTFVTNLSISDILITDNQVTFTYHDPLRVKEDNKSNTLFSIQPNPATTYVEIILSDSQLFSNSVLIQIFDVQGLLMKTEQLNNEKTRIDLSNFAKGFYIIKVGKEAKKLIIK